MPDFLLFRRVGALGLTCVIGCGLGTQHIDRETNEALANIRSRTDAAFVYTSCDGGGIGPSCGLVAKHASKESFRERFRERVCASKSDEECQLVFNRFVDAQLRTRYTNADWDEVIRHCDAHPLKCGDLVEYELLLVDSHNARVRERRSDEEIRIRAEHARKKEEHDAALGAGIGRMLNELSYAAHEGPKCRSYPSVVTGSTLTTCTH